MRISRTWWKVAFWVLAIAAAACLIWIVRSTGAFGHCIHERKNYKEYQALHENALFVIKLFVRLGLNSVCTAHAANVYQGVMAALTAIAIATFTFTLWQSTEKLWRAGREALETTERAFVFIDGFDYELTIFTDTHHNPTEIAEFGQSHNPALWITRFAAQPRWKNGGNTPTRNMTIQVDWRQPGGTLPVEFDYPYRGFRERFFLAPRSTEPSDFIEMPGANEIINEGMPHPGLAPMMFIWGRADYQDIFGHWHFAQWCYQVRFDRHRGARLRAQFIQWGDNNRTDEDRA